MTETQLENHQQLKALIKAHNIAEALQLLAAIEKWSKAALGEALYELAWQASRYEAPPWTDEHQALATALLDADANPSVRRGYDLTPLHCAAEKHNLSLVALLLEHGAEVNATTTEERWFSGHRRTPLYVALREEYNEVEHLPVIRALLEAGANPNINAYTSPPDTPLTLALEHGEMETAKLLVAHGAHINRKRPSGGGVSSRTLPVVVATEHAVRHNDLPPLKWLLKLEANPNVKVMFDVTPLGIAAKSGNLAVIQALIQAGADVNWQHGSALTRAAEHSNIEVVQRLLELGATAHVRALGSAIERHDLALVQLLIEHGAPLDKRSTYTDKKLPLAYARANPEQNAEIIAYLLSIVTERDPQKARRQTQQYHNKQLLKVAINPRAGRPLAHWLERGANPNSHNRYRRTALHYVVERGEDRDLHNARLLLDAGADVNARDKFGYTPLHQAARHDNPVLLAALLDAGADPAATLTKGRLAGWTPLHFALSYQHAANVALLRPLSPPVGQVEPGSHSLRGVFTIDYDAFKPSEKTSRIHLHEIHRCVKCHERALYVIGGIWDGTDLHAEITSYFICANCGAHQTQDWGRGLRLYSGCLPWHVLE
jgi:ankyrin repeat protein